MITESTILTTVLSNLGVQYQANKGIVTYGSSSNLINYVHPLLTNESIGSLAEMNLPFYKGEWIKGRYQISEIVIYKNKYYISPIKDNEIEPETEDSEWKLYDPISASIQAQFDSYVKKTISEIYAKIKSKGQSEDIFHSGYIFQRNGYQLNSDSKVIRLIPRTGNITINKIKFTSKESSSVTYRLVDLEYYNSVATATITVNTKNEVTINKSSKYGFVLFVTTTKDLFNWDFIGLSKNLKCSQRTNFAYTDLTGYNEDYFSNVDSFCCEIDAKIQCDLTDWFVNNIEILIPYIKLKVAHDWLKSIYYNGSARSNKHEANEKILRAEFDIYGDKANDGSLIKEINELEKSIISKYGYGSPCFKARKSKIKYESI